MINPLISVIVPVYNVERYLPKCVDSILTQTYSNLEIFLVDDGSPDCCGAICDEYARQDSRIRVIHKENGGQAEARNVAIDASQGEYITFVDSDDIVSPDYVESLYRLVEKYQCKIGLTLCQTFYEEHEISRYRSLYKERVFSKLEGVEALFYQEMFNTAPWCKIYHRTLFEAGIRFPVGLIYEDLGAIYLLFLQADRIAFCNHIAYYYRLRKDSTEGSPFNVKKLDSGLKILEMIQSHAAELEPVKKAVRCRLLSFCYHILLDMPADYPDTRKSILLNYVKENRWKVLMDRRARKKARVACLLSYLGSWALYLLAAKGKSRKS